MRHVLPTVLIAAFVALHQDLWFWRTAEPLLFGVLPPGLWYHALYAVGTAALNWWLVRTIWPDHLEHD